MPLLVDEAHYVAGGENVVDQIATHRAAGLEPAFGLQYFAQLGSASEHQQKILKGVLNLLQSRFLFRMGDAQDAEQATRIAMAVYATMIRDDPDSRARLRVTPEQLLNFPNYYCLASWIANGTRAPSFTGQTYPLPDIDDDWAEHHLAAQAERVGPYPEQLESTLDTHAPDQSPSNGATGRSASPSGEYLACPTSRRTTPSGSERAGTRRERWYIPAGTDPFDRWRAQPHTPRDADHDEDHETPRQPTPRRSRQRRTSRQRRGARRARCRWTTSPAASRRTSPTAPSAGSSDAGYPAPPRGEHDAPAPDSLRELAFLDRINEIGPADQLDGAAKPAAPLRRGLRDPRAARPRRTRAAHADRPRRAARTRAAAAVIDRLTKLYRHGLIAQHPTGLREHTRSDGKPPLLYSLTRRGLEVAQTREPPGDLPQTRMASRSSSRRAACASPTTCTRSPGRSSSTALVGDVATDHWRTPRYATGRYPVPQAGSGRDRHPITAQRDPGPRRAGDHRPRRSRPSPRSSPTSRSNCASTR